MKKTQKSIDQLKKRSVLVIEKNQQIKVKGGVDKTRTKIPTWG